MRRLEVLSGEPTLRSPGSWQVAGHPGHVPARFDVVTGARRFVSDLDRPGMLHGAVLRPPVVGSTLREVDLGPAERSPGATVIREGDFVAVAAGDPATARRMVEAIDAKWDVPPPGPRDVVAHLRAHPVAGQGWERKMDETVGDVDAALKAASQRIDATYTTAYLAHIPLETRAAVAEWDGDRLTVWVGTQVPFGVRAQLAEELGLEEGDVRVIVPPTGGGFGGKHSEEIALEAARLARGAGRPVKVRWNRAEEFRWGHLRPMAVIDVRAGIDPNGSITAWDFLDINAGTAGITPPYTIANRRLRYQPADSPWPRAPTGHSPRPPTTSPGSRSSTSSPTPSVTIRSSSGSAAWPTNGSSRCSKPPPTDSTGTRVAPRRCAASGARAWRSGWRRAAGWRPLPGCASKTTARIRVTEIVTAYECGAVVNPDTVINQIEGGTIMALGGALFEEMALERGRVAKPSLAGYRVPRFSDLPALRSFFSTVRISPLPARARLPSSRSPPPSRTRSSRPPVVASDRSRSPRRHRICLLRRSGDIAPRQGFRPSPPT